VKKLRTYTAYSIGCVIAWAIILSICATTESSHHMGYILCIFYGWVVCWVSATIARITYPPPAKWLRDLADSENSSA
jgi:hypothetical protein